MRIRVEVSIDPSTAQLLGQAVDALRRIAAAAERIERNTAPPRFAISFQIILGGINVKSGKVFSGTSKGRRLAQTTPVSITNAAGGQEIAVVGLDAAGVPGAQLATGATIAITVGNGASGKVAATFAPDATPQPVSYVDENGNSQTNVPPLISGKLATATPVDPNDPFAVSYAITNADGSAGDTGSGQAQIVPGTETSEVLVLNATASAPPAASTSAKSAK